MSDMAAEVVVHMAPDASTAKTTVAEEVANVEEAVAKDQDAVAKEGPTSLSLLWPGYLCVVRCRASFFCAVFYICMRSAESSPVAKFVILRLWFRACAATYITLAVSLPPECISHCS